MSLSQMRRANPARYEGWVSSLMPCFASEATLSDSHGRCTTEACTSWPARAPDSGVRLQRAAVQNHRRGLRLAPSKLAQQHAQVLGHGLETARPNPTAADRWACSATGSRCPPHSEGL